VSIARAGVQEVGSTAMWEWCMHEQYSTVLGSICSYQNLYVSAFRST